MPIVLFIKTHNIVAILNRILEEIPPSIHMANNDNMAIKVRVRFSSIILSY